MLYVRDVPRGDDRAFKAERAHVIDHLAAAASPDDDPDTYHDQVHVQVEDHPDDPDLQRIVGELDAEPDAPYLKPGYDLYHGVDPDLFAAEVEAAQRDAEPSHG